MKSMLRIHFKIRAYHDARDITIINSIDDTTKYIFDEMYLVIYDPIGRGKCYSDCLNFLGY
jgi:hypothetical protein